MLALAATAMVCTQARAQRPLVAVVLPTDSGSTRKLAVREGDSVPKSANGFAHRQMGNARVLAARTEKKLELKQLFRQRGLEYPAAEIFIRAFKREHIMEMWVRPAASDTFVLLKSYEICALNDKPGPKRSLGDEQTPEGFYYIDDFNPRSDYHLSLRVSYPNRSDARLGSGHTLGGNVFIHGGCKTAGCLAITDENIKEVYWLAVEARDHGQTRIPVHIFPTRLSDNGLQVLGNVFNDEPDLVRFWSNLKRGYDYFEQTHKLPTVSFNARGRYVFNAESKDLLGKPVAQDSSAASTALTHDQ